MGHEIIGHKGLRYVFGENFDSMLDSVYRDHAEEINKYAQRYNVAPDSIQGQRYLTEEFLADHANARTKPSWWKEFIARLRQALRKIMPKLQISNREIEGYLSLSARAVRSQRMATPKQNLDVDGDGTVTDGDERNGTEFADDKAFPIRSENDYAAVRNILHNIQGNILDNEDTGIKAKLSSTGVNKMLSNKARSKSKNNGFEDAEHLLAAANVDRLFANAVLMEDRPDRNNDPNIVSIKRFSAPFYTNGQFAEARLTVKESIEHGNRLYSLELDEIKKPSSPDRGGLDEQADTPALDGYNKLVRKIKNASAKIKNNEQKDQIRFSIAPVYTGSAADYSQPSLQYVGSGEGAQVYGWGLYGSSSEDVARWYAQADYERKYSREAALLDGKEFDYTFSDGSLLSEIKMTTLLDVKEHKGNIDAVINEYQGYIDENVYSADDVEWLKQCIDFLKSNRHRISYRPSGEYVNKRNLYSQTFWPDKQENLLDWDGNVSAAQLDQIAEALKNAVDNTAEAGRSDTNSRNGFEFERKTFLTNLGFNKAAGISGQQLYNDMIYVFGSPKAASEFLYRAGIDGITYLGDSSGVRNYVAFSDKDIRVDEHIRYSMAPEYSVAVDLPELDLSKSREFENWMEDAIAGDTWRDPYGNTMWNEDDPEDEERWRNMPEEQRREIIEDRYEEDLRNIKFEEESDNDFARSEAMQEAFGQIEEIITGVLEDNGFELDRAKINLRSSSFYISFEDEETGDYYTIRRLLLQSSNIFIITAVR